MLAKLFGRAYQPLNTIEISKKNLLNNYRHLSSINRKLKIAPVLKSNAYGHGLIPIAKLLSQKNPPFFCVDSLYEAYELSKSGITTQILIMGFIDPISLKTKKLPYSFAVYSRGQIDTLSKYQPQAKIHIFVDTGMHREGILPEELPEFLGYINKTSLEIEGIMSHFGESENSKNPLTIQQIRKFEHILKIIKPKYVHISNSGGILNNFGIGNIGRAGIALYGISPISANNRLKPCLTLTTHIAQIKNLKKGESVGYNFTYKAKKEIKIAILPIGYNDGVNRRLSNKGIVTIRGVECKIIGRISMNITTIDITDIKNTKVGDEITIFSNNIQAKNSIENTAKLCGSIPYELLVGLAPSTRRVIR